MKKSGKKIKWLTLLIYPSIIFLVCNGCSNHRSFNHETEHEKSKVIKEKWHWDNPDKQSNSAGYAQVVKAGKTIYISGVPANELSAEGIARLYQALEESLNAFGATAKDVVMETLYTTDIERMKELNHVRKKFYKGDYPAASWVQIDRLYQANAKVEVDLIAVINDVNE